MSYLSLPHEVPAWEVLGIGDEDRCHENGKYIGACNEVGEWGYLCTLPSDHIGRHVAHMSPEQGREMACDPWGSVAPPLVPLDVVRSDLFHVLFSTS